MNDEKIEQLLRELPTPELPEAWRAEILSKARREARTSISASQVWPTALLYLRNLCLRNPITATAMAMLWILIFSLKVSTPVDPQERWMLANYDPNKPVHFVSMKDEMIIVQLALDQSGQKPPMQMP